MSFVYVLQKGPCAAAPMAFSRKLGTILFLRTDGSVKRQKGSVLSVLSVYKMQQLPFLSKPCCSPSSLFSIPDFPSSIDLAAAASLIHTAHPRSLSCSDEAIKV